MTGKSFQIYIEQLEIMKKVKLYVLKVLMHDCMHFCFESKEIQEACQISTVQITPDGYIKGFFIKAVQLHSSVLKITF